MLCTSGTESTGSRSHVQILPTCSAPLAPRVRGVDITHALRFSLNCQCIVGNWRVPVLGDLNERAISLEEVGEEVNEMKSGKAPGLDGFQVECLKKGGMAVLE